MRISDWSSDVCSSDLHIVAVVLDADRALRITVHRDVADRQPGDARAGVGARGHIVEEARDIIRLDVLDGQVAHVPADADGRADILEGEIAEPQIVGPRSEEHTSELQSLMRRSYAVFCLKKNTTTK